MATKICMPALSPTMETGNIVKWHKTEKETVESGEVLLEIETDKAIMEVEAVDEGIIHILIPDATDDVPINTVIALLLEEGESLEEAKAFLEKETKNISSQEKKQEAQENFNIDKVVEASLSEKRIKASPLARKIAQQENIDLFKIRGTGPRGRIVKRDIHQYQEKDSILPTSGESFAGYAQSGIEKQESEEKNTNNIGPANYIEQAPSQMRKAIAEVLTYSKQHIPHFYLSLTCEMDELLKLRTSLNEALGEKLLSINDLLTRACALALAQVPQMNRTWHDGMIRSYAGVDFAVAVAVEGGIFTPVLRSVEKKSLNQLSQELKNLIQKAREKTLISEEFSGGVLTLTNLGMFGIEFFQSIIPPTQSSILSIGSIEKKPIVRGKDIEIGNVLVVTLAADHRVIDGKEGALFLQKFKNFVQNPLLLLY